MNLRCASRARNYFTHIRFGPCLPGRFCLVAVAACFAALPLLAQRFKNPTLISTGTNPAAVSTADFNGDGKPDLVYLDGSSSSTLHILRGKGDGTFVSAQDTELPLGIGGKITVADVNKDGKPDLVLGGKAPQGQVCMLLGNGDGTFGSPLVSQFPAGGNLYATMGSQIGVADFNGDGAVDLAAGDILNNVVYVLLGNNTGSFTLKATLFNGGGPSNVFTGDFNGDGHVDVLAQGMLAANATVYLGKGDGTFQAGVSYAGPQHIGSMLLRDMDGDGHADLVVTDQNQGVDILRGNQDGTFASTSSGGTAFGVPGATLLAIADLNSDGTLDLAMATANGVSILLGQVGLSYSAPVAFSGSPSPWGAVMADFNGDGHQDFAELAPGGIAIAFGAPGGALQSGDLYDLGEPLNAVVVSDFTGDHVLDIAVNASEATPRLLKGLGGGKFSIVPGTGQGTGTNSSATLFTGDFNGDGKADLLQTGSIGGPSLFYGRGDGTFLPPVSVSTLAQNSYGDVVVADFNRDGASDLAALDYESLDILLGQHNNTFIQKSNPFFTLAFSNGAAAGDFNNDGKPDLVVTQVQANPLQILLGKGDGSFDYGRQLTAESLPQALAVADLDGDGKNDIIACLGFFQHLQIFYGNGDGTFSGPNTLLVERQYTEMAVADLDGDGKPDIVLSDGSVLTVIRNAGSRTFGAEEHYLAGAIANFVLKDVSGDGLPDIVVANGNGAVGSAPSTVTVMINEGSANTISGQLQVTPEPTTYGSPFSVSLSMMTQGSSTATPSGSVAISIDEAGVASLPVNTLNLTYTDANNPPLPVGVHTIVAAYSGDQNYLPGTFVAQLRIVPVVYPTNTALTASLTHVVASQTVRFTATVSSPGQNVNAPNTINGIVEFRDGTTNLGGATLNAARTATFDTALLAAGTHSITASYLGYTASFAQTGSFAPSTSAPVTIVVTASPTTTSLTAAPESVPAGALVSLTAKVTSSSGTPTGAVTFLDGASPLAVQPLDATGTAVFSSALASTGSHAVTASYQANATFAGSTSPPVTVTAVAQAAPSSVQLSVMPGSQSSHQVILTAYVTGRTLATGQVVFMDGATTLGKAALNSKSAAVSTFPLDAPGLHYLTAYYPGNSQLGPAVSPAVIERAPLSVPDFSVSLSATGVTIHPDQSVQVAATVIPMNGFRSQVSLRCAAANPYISCRVGRASQPDGLGTFLMSIGTNPVRASLVGAPASSPDVRSLVVGLATLMLLACLVLKPLRWRFAFSFGCLLCVVLAIGCGSREAPVEKTFLPAGTYVLTVEASSAGAGSSSPVVHTVEIKVNVEPQ